MRILRFGPKGEYFIKIPFLRSMKAPAARLIMVMGLPGSGKTYFAKALAQYMGATHFNSDRIRKGSMKQATYTAQDKSRIYHTMFARVTEALEQGETVIVDATFSKAAYREPYLRWAAAHRVKVNMLFMEATEAIIADRIDKKRPDSDADFDVYRTIQAEYEPIAEAHRVLRSDIGSTAERIKQAVDHIEEQSPTS